jgi:hypothetical protein
MTLQQLRYRPAPLYADYARAGAGLLMTGLPPLLLNVHSAVALFLAVCAALFAAFGFRTAQRHATVVELTDHGLAVRGPLGTVIPWNELSRVTLRYYSTRRDRGQGWMQLTLRGRDRSVRLESTLDRFDDVAEQAACAARANGLDLSDSTLANFAALGIDADPPDSRPEAR